MADTNTSTSTPAGSTNKPLTGSLLNSATKPTSSPVMKPVEPAKDPKGMFDWSDAKPYVIGKDENLFDVAQKFSVALQQLRYFNHINKATMKVKEGQTIYIPNKPVEVPYGA
ncbi:LysM peptidoglycan-binding domain-containing protein [Lactobacillus crispatus]|uniref:LysM peptidoglycan-binding domain-containing protein n=1 Tax=Lactobacillus crispatus TaxID=47770 RepID=UPI00105EF6FD|nr:LysM peptidoglycan-binding domain-containing protein [Lactobacillus crispatus]MBH9539030.1 LysM peptidoglycan-binding domain-containing protein [Lactobacillus crispatus]MCZ3559105.1 LysM peptidoglycan-binding domain-containing protein [Lactobacillus crispatus]MCZ3561267.1 LysM peptidoglycan-binding domain-containing protein [Lactobacillus crispatus]MCZ3563419.1 LysM peptidoglycan-binding domain-containing protein [Lactobacillus crispatus]MCZ3565417.1 LysM peptidoglycan-binding domain-contai